MTARLPTRHFDDILLFEYATGVLPEPLAIAVATHVALCARCRAAVAGGGALSEAPEPAPLVPQAPDGVVIRLDEDSVVAPVVGPGLPAPLRAYLGDDLDALDWQMLAAGVDAAELQPAAGRRWPPRSQVLLVRLMPGAAAPRHTHEGIEATVILQGGFADQFGQYDRGDAWIVDGSVTHGPVALPGEPCLCLAYYDAPMKPIVQAI